VPIPDCCFILVSAEVPTSALADSFGLLGYVGLGPGQEFIPYFLALLAWAGAACLAILLWPLRALRQRLARTRDRHTGGPTNGSALANRPESEQDADDTRVHPQAAGHHDNSTSAGAGTN
jgi:hypothetical protein